MKMIKPAQHFPSVQGLQAFEAAARLGSFAEAAEELSLTTSAVSHRIRTLENYMGTVLFVRDRQKAALSPQGEQFLGPVRSALQNLVGAISQFRRNHKGIRVSVLPSISHRWLLARLGHFTKAYPHIDLHLESSQRLVDLTSEGFDLSIRYGNGQWPGLSANKLGTETLVAVASPSLFQEHKCVDEKLFLRARLLRDESHPWSMVLDEEGMSGKQLNYGALFDDTSQLLAAAEHGQGIALGRSWLVSDALRDGRLKRVGKSNVEARGAYYLVSAVALGQMSMAAQQFSQWLNEMFVAEKANIIAAD
jgi:LysR family glycine cleavage system transcriptional activator